MPDQMDFELRKNDAAAEPIEPIDPIPPRYPAGTLFVIGMMVLAAIAAIYVVFGRPTAAPVDEPTAPPVAETTQEITKPLGANADSIEVPPLDQSDPIVRGLVQQLSSHPRVAVWLTTEGLIRNFTVVVANLAEGSTPTVHLRPLAPSGPFRIVEQDDDLVIDRRSYERYDRLADAAASIDAAGAARLYATLKPRIEEAYRDLGMSAGSFDRTLERAIVSVLATPIVEGPIDVVPRGIVYGYAEPRLESLTAAQKHLLRMGPRTVRAIQAKLREIALELGIPAARLPAPR